VALASAMRAIAADPAGQRRSFETTRPSLLELVGLDAAARFLASFGR
jgi:hypothetical protein